jgi:hypothetical protein
VTRRSGQVDRAGKKQAAEFRHSGAQLICSPTRVLLTKWRASGPDSAYTRSFSELAG